MDTKAAVIVDASGKPARPAITPDCPTCGAAPALRTASAGFGIPHPICRRCGHEFLGEVWRG